MWSEQAKLLPADGAREDYFGYSVSIGGGTALVGAYRDDDAGDSSGSAYVFRFDGSQWTQQQKLTASDGSPGDAFGSRVAIEDGVIVVGAPSDDAQFVNQGSVYVFRFDGSSWVESQNLGSSTLTANAQYGAALELEQGRLAVGAPGDDGAFVYRDFGTAFLFTQQLAVSAPTAADAIRMPGPRSFQKRPIILRLWF